jgi:dTDP-4-dehydrorhamnose reductase
LGAGRLVTTIAILGAGGLLSNAMKKEAEKRLYRVIGLSKKELDISKREQVIKVLNQIKPDVVINTAAFMNADNCENNPTKAYETHVLGARNVSEFCCLSKSIHVWFSTDFVFDGTKGTPYTEQDTVNPLMIYGKTKYSGEKEIEKCGGQYYIIRTASLFGHGKSHFLDKMIGKVKAGQHLEIVDDIIMSPTYTQDLSEAVFQVIEDGAPSGIYHLTNNGSTSWYNYFNTALTLMGMSPQISRVSYVERQQSLHLPPRPLYSALTSVKWNHPLRDWEDALENYQRSGGYG